MRIAIVGLIFGSLVIAAAGQGQPLGLRPGEVVERAPDVAPKICRATAAEHDGELVVRISAPAVRLQERDANNPRGRGWMQCWAESFPLVLGRQVQAYSTSGRLLDKQAVAKALAQPTGVVCFERLHPDDAENPDPAYASLFRDDVVLLVFPLPAKPE